MIIKAIKSTLTLWTNEGQMKGKLSLLHAAKMVQDRDIVTMEW